jgi:TldD protein
MEDPKGWGIQIQGILAERIQNGKLTGELFTNITMTGYLPTILNNIKMIANDLEVKGTGRCGKQHKEWVRVSEGGPHMLIEEVELG